MNIQVEGAPALADDRDPSSPDRKSAFSKALFLAAKVIVSAGCFWYALRQIDLGDTVRTLPAFHFHWAAVAVAVAVMQIPLLALRLWSVVHAVTSQAVRLSYRATCAVTAIYTSLAQVLPSVVGEGIRAWMLTRFGCGWRAGLTSVMIDRAAGVMALIVFAFVILLLPSPLTALAGHRSLVVFGFSAALVTGAFVLFAIPRIAALLQQWQYSYWVGTFAADAYRVLLGRRAPIIFGAACLIHTLTILIIWLVGCAQGLALSMFDSAVLFTVMVGVALVPISVGGWGIRELAVVSLLGAQGLAPERALIFSVCFGLVTVLSVLPGLIVWLLYPLPRPPGARSNREADRLRRSP
jgi:uncharacterized membrane protein YbhN (UPF0104 family)